MRTSRSFRLGVPGPFLLASAALLAGRCAPPPSLASEPAAEDAHEAVQFTVREAGYELFVEYEAPLVAEAVRFITHVTDTRTGEPRRAGPVTFRMRSPGGDELEHIEEAPARDGIYLPELSFPTAGEWAVSIEIPQGTGTAVVPFPAVLVHADRAALQDAVLPEAPEGIGFLKEQQWRLHTRIQPLMRRSLTHRIEVPAIVRPAPERQASVTPPVAGRLEAVEGKTLPRLGLRVEKNELLAYVRPPFSDYLVRMQAAKAEVVRSRLASERAQAILERVEKLYERKARSESDLEEARFAARIAEAESAAAEAVSKTLGMSGIATSDGGQVRFELRAPIAGFVREVGSVNGAFVDAKAPVFRLRDSSVVHVEALVRPDALAGVVDRERPLILRLRGVGGVKEVFLARAKLVFVGDEIDAHTLTVPVHFEVPNPDQELRIGELVEVQFPTGPSREELALPLTALVEEDGRYVVFVQLGGETFEKRYPELGFRDGSYIQVVSGVAEGEWVVTEGPYAIRLASAAGTVPVHGHAH